MITEFIFSGQLSQIISEKYDTDVGPQNKLTDAALPVYVISESMVLAANTNTDRNIKDVSNA